MLQASMPMFRTSFMYRLRTKTDIVITKTVHLAAMSSLERFSYVLHVKNDTPLLAYSEWKTLDG